MVKFQKDSHVRSNYVSCDDNDGSGGGAGGSHFGLGPLWMENDSLGAHWK